MSDFEEYDEQTYLERHTSDLDYVELNSENTDSIEETKSIFDKISENTPWKYQNTATIVGILLQLVSILDGRTMVAMFPQNLFYMATQETAYQLMSSPSEVKRKIEHIDWKDRRFVDEFNETRYFVENHMSGGVTLSFWLLIVDLIWKWNNGFSPFSAHATNIFDNKHFEQSEQVEWQLESNDSYFDFNILIALGMPFLAKLITVLQNCCTHQEENSLSSSQKILIPLLILSMLVGIGYGFTHETVVRLGETMRPYMYNNATVNAEFDREFNEDATWLQKMNNNYALTSAQEKNEKTDTFTGHTASTTLAWTILFISIKSVIPTDHWMVGYATFILSNSVGILEGLCRNFGQAHSFGSMMEAVLISTLIIMISLKLAPQFCAQLEKVFEDLKTYFYQLVEEINRSTSAAAQRPGLVIADIAGFTAGLFTAPVKISCEAVKKAVYYFADKPAAFFETADSAKSSVTEGSEYGDPLIFKRANSV